MTEDKIRRRDAFCERKEPSCKQKYSTSVYFHCTTWVKKRDTILLSIASPNINTDFQNSFTFRLRNKFAIKRLLKIPPHLKFVATLPCNIWMSKTRNNLKHGYWLTINFNNINWSWQVFTVLWVTVSIENVLLWPACNYGDTCATGLWHRQ